MVSRKIGTNPKKPGFQQHPMSAWSSAINSRSARPPYNHARTRCTSPRTGGSDRDRVSHIPSHKTRKRARKLRAWPSTSRRFVRYVGLTALPSPHKCQHSRSRHECIGAYPSFRLSKHRRRRYTCLHKTWNVGRPSQATHSGCRERLDAMRSF